MPMSRPSPSPFAHHWDLDPDVMFLNHGSFGATPRVVMEEQREWQRRLEREPVLFIHRELEQHQDVARVSLAQFVGCQPDDLAFVTNATQGVNTVLRSLNFSPGDELLVTDHEYNACRNALEFVAAKSGARIVTAPILFPLATNQQVISAVLAHATARTKLLLIDHVTSATGTVFPVAELVAQFTARGIDTLVDGAHAPGMLPLDLDRLGAAYYTGNCHKWLCTPKGAALLHVRRDRQAQIRPLAISHGANSMRTDRSRFRLEFDFTGTCDPSPWLCIPSALRFLNSLLPGGMLALRKHNHDLAVLGRARLCNALQSEPPVPAAMLGSLASVILRTSTALPEGPLALDPLQLHLFDEHKIEVPVMRWQQPKLRMLRISPQIYNTVEQYDFLAQAVRAFEAQS
ncbi:isopenicillin-N epimerase [Planctomycetota bacterium]|nr:isopenicillin-N epimerase [Planctomycetota bacterium]